MSLVIERYLKENIDGNIRIEIFKDTKKIPVYLRGFYNFHIIELLGRKYILLGITEEAPRIDVIKKHIHRIEKITNLKTILYYKEITRYRRKSLIENNISFLIENGQMFLPFIGLDLKKTDDYIEKGLKIFTPSAQIAYLYFLYNKEIIVNTTEFSKIFGWNLMTASRALNELYDARLIDYKIGGKTGRSKEYRRVDDPEYFKKGSLLLQTPIIKVIYLENPPKKSYIAGLEALSRMSMINPPNYKVRAISSEYLKNKDIKIIKNKDIIKDEKLVKVQIWKYDPELFAKNDIVDKVSLYETLKEENDERIEQALEEVLQGERWYMD